MEMMNIVSAVVAKICPAFFWECLPQVREALKTSRAGGSSISCLSPNHITTPEMPHHNWITAYTGNPERQPRFDETEGHWVEMQDRLNRWGSGHAWDRLQQRGTIARTDQNG